MVVEKVLFVVGADGIRLSRLRCHSNIVLIVVLSANSTSTTTTTTSGTCVSLTLILFVLFCVGT